MAWFSSRPDLLNLDLHFPKASKFVFFEWTWTWNFVESKQWLQHNFDTSLDELHSCWISPSFEPSTQRVSEKKTLQIEQLKNVSKGKWYVTIVKKIQPQQELTLGLLYQNDNTYSPVHACHSSKSKSKLFSSEAGYLN